MGDENTGWALLAMTFLHLPSAVCSVGPPGNDRRVSAVQPYRIVSFLYFDRRFSSRPPSSFFLVSWYSAKLPSNHRT